MSPARIYKLRLALNAAHARLDEIERLLNEHEGVTRVMKKAAKAKRKPARKASKQRPLRANVSKKARAAPAKRNAPAKTR